MEVLVDTSPNNITFERFQLGIRSKPIGPNNGNNFETRFD